VHVLALFFIFGGFNAMRSLNQMQPLPDIENQTEAGAFIEQWPTDGQ
jgi:hypothetical protein